MAEENKKDLNQSQDVSAFFGNFDIAAFEEDIDKQVRESLYNLGFDSAPSIGLNRSDPAVSYRPSEAEVDDPLLGGEVIRSRYGDKENEDYGTLAALIASGEGTWDSFNRGTTGSGGNMPELLSMSLGEIDARQHSKGSAKYLFAVGRYQFTPHAFLTAMKGAGLTKNDIFSKTNQTRMFWGLILNSPKRPKLKAYLTGKSSDEKAALVDLASEWAAVKQLSGAGVFDGDAGGNKATISANKALQALRDARKALLTNQRGYVDGKLKYKG